MAYQIRDANGTLQQILTSSGDGLTAATAFARAVGGAAANGVAVVGNPVLCGGTDGTNARSLQTDAAGILKTADLPPGTALSASATAAATATTVTLTGGATTKVYLAGLVVSGLGATAVGSIQITTTGLTGNLTFTLPIPAGVTVPVTPLNVQFCPPLPASAINTPVVVTVPSFGAGNTVASASAWGFHV